MADDEMLERLNRAVEEAGCSFAVVRSAPGEYRAARRGGGFHFRRFGSVWECVSYFDGRLLKHGCRSPFGPLRGAGSDEELAFRLEALGMGEP